jgi:hypothetical protein
MQASSNAARAASSKEILAHAKHLPDRRRATGGAMPGGALLAGGTRLQ